MNDTVLLKNGVLIDFEPLKLERRDILVVDGRVAAREEKIDAPRGARVIDCRGRFIMPGLVNAHTHLFASQTLGMPEDAGPAPLDRVERALTPETIVTAAFAGALDAVRLGTTTIIDRHRSSNHVAGSLDLVSDTAQTVGLRVVLGYELTSDANAFEDSLAENRRFVLDNRSDKARGVLGARGVSSFEPRALERLAEVAEETGALLHITVEHGETGVPALLDEAGLLTPRTILTHVARLDEAECELVHSRGTWVVHCATSTALGGGSPADVRTFGELAALGTAGNASDMLSEARSAYVHARSSGANIRPEDVIKMIVGGQHVASEVLGLELGSTRRDAGADFLILGYSPRTPMDAENLASHVLFGMGPSHIEQVMIDGEVVYRTGQHPTVDTRRLGPLVRKGAHDLWRALAPETPEEEVAPEPAG